MRTKRAIIEIGEHSVYWPCMRAGVVVFDIGANHGEFASAIEDKFRGNVLAIEANPELASSLTSLGYRTIHCAITPTAIDTIDFHLSANDQASTLLVPRGSLFWSKADTVRVPAKTMSELLRDYATSTVGCVKMDIEGSECEVLMSLKKDELEKSLQWTIEFHDDPQFGLSTRSEVSDTIRWMKKNGFSVLVRNWPSRSNVLFVNRNELKIHLICWWLIVLRYQWIGWLWRKLRRIHFRRSH